MSTPLFAPLFQYIEANLFDLNVCCPDFFIVPDFQAFFHIRCGGFIIDRIICHKINFCFRKFIFNFGNDFMPENPEQ